VSVPEVRRLLLGLAWAALPEAERVLAWSEWRRAHQAAARKSHYKRRKSKDTS
jgi:hypothetical protein